MVFEDTGEMIACSVTLSNTHMPGYPLLILLGKLFSLLPVGSPGFRINLLSAVAGASAVTILWVIVLRLAGGMGAGRLASWAAGITAVTAYGLAPKSWEYSGMGDKYPLFVAIYAGAVLAMLDSVLRPRARTVLLASFLSGLALGHHLMGLYLIPALGWILLRRNGGARVIGGRSLVFASLFFLLPIMGRTLYPPIRAEANAPINWEMPNRAPRLVSYLSVAAYRDRFHAPTSPGKMSLTTVQNSLWTLESEAWPILLFSVLGIWVIFSAPLAKPAGILLSVLALSGVVVAAPFGERNIAHFHLTLCWLAAVLGGVGMGWLVSRKKWLAVLAVVLAVIQLVRGWPAGMQDRRYAAWDHMKNITSRLRGPGIVAAYDDKWLFPLWYATEVEGQAPGVRIINRRSFFLDTPEHKQLAEMTRAPVENLDACDNELLMFWEVAGRINPGTLWIEPMGTPLPSTGADWDGILARINRSGGDFGISGNPVSCWKRMRIHRLMNPRTIYEAGLTAGLGRVLAAQAVLLRDQGRKGESVELVRLGSRLVPGLPELAEVFAASPVVGDASRQASAGLVYSGMEDYNRGRYRRAMESWKSALRLDPQQFQASYELGRLAELEGRYGEAESIYADLNRKAPWVPEVAEAKGRAQSEIALQASLPDLIRRVKPKDPKSLCDVGNACFGLNRINAAEHFYRQALAVDRKYPRAWRNLGSVLVLREGYRGAIRAFENSLKYGPNDIGVMTDLAMVLFKAGNRRKALVWADKAKKLSPHDPRVAAALAMVGK